MDLKLLKFILSIIASHLGILLNCFLLWLIKNKSGPQLVGYRKILYLGATFDVIFSFVTASVQPLVVSAQGWYFIVAEGWISFLGHPLAYFLMVCHVYLSYASMTVASVQFIYRFFLICCDITLKFKAFTFLVIISLLIPSYFLVTFLILLYPQSNDIENYASILSASGMTFRENDNVFIVNLVSTMTEHSAASVVISIGSHLIILFCSIAVILRLWWHRKHFHLSDKKMQNQITIVLFCEAAVPLMTMVIPLQLLSFVFVPWLPTVFSFMIALSPIFNPIVKIFVIAPFRSTVFGIIKQDSKVSTTIIISSTSKNF